eukprot:m.44334 g.44334  ORF g.44334 m.44334 type:complete len:166 (+) comp10899_c0_seq1:23-520(+)
MSAQLESLTAAVNALLTVLESTRELATVSTIEKLSKEIVRCDEDLQDALAVVHRKLELQQDIKALREAIQERQVTISKVESVLATSLQSLEQKTFQGRQAVQAYEAATQAPLDVAAAVHAARRIGCSFTAAAPPTWGPESTLRPFPTELQMGASSLAQHGVSDWS